ncbi:MAG: tetratricopeptide repeat protein [Anaerolineae bacterium]|uniref:tetratricopeptide repeat protein n=1 Tax=Promineifilum sp. TaxID=2664178 RepID=UPI001DEBC171|nr:tetratricopeptide repeat protein [Anaerolineales bacterium]MCO5181237.1 tetratricopeptide repeat protein [Promineifilum sp.]MCW5847957.1 tetratricopeptide repeat protein [Anaerolineae bacterium]
MSKQEPSSTRRPPGQHPSRSELRASVVWPVAISVAIWLAGLVIWIIAPGRLDVLVSGIIAAGLVVYLVWYQRQIRMLPSERLFSLLLAVPAVLGITLGLVRGEAIFAITGVSASLLLLTAQRGLSAPFSYRMALRSFNRGHLETALDLVDKAIDARPVFWESYQLRSLIYLSVMQFGQAERDALKALELRPDAHPVHNTLGQLYLAGSQYERAAEAYGKAIDLSPKQALYHFYRGLALYRLGEARDAAESLAASTRLGLPDVTYELQAYYYLGRALEQNGEIEKAEEIFADMVKFADGLEMLKADLKQQPDFPELAALRADVRDMQRRLASAVPQK